MNYNNSYEKNIVLERKFAKEIKCILGLQFIGQDTIMDKEQATDFLTFTINSIKVGARLRRYDIYLNHKYRQQFTIRCKLTSGNRTELDKIRDGFADYILYGFVNKQEDKIIQYFIGDLNVFRDYENGMDCEACKNVDENPSSFKAYYIKDFPNNFVVKDYQSDYENHRRV